MTYPGDIPSFNEFYTEYFDPVEKSFEVRRKSRTDGSLSITEAMEYFDRYLKSYQTVYVPNKADKTLIFFPFMFNKPHEGDLLLNSTTKETYKVTQIITNPSTGQWEGVLKLDLKVPPSVESLHPLVYLNQERLVKFSHEVPDVIPNPVGANLEKLLKQPPPMNPTVTWTIKSVEPGSLGAIGNSKKEWKPRIRESVKDPLVPGYTVDIYGQFFDNIVQFDCWSNDPRTSDRLVRWFEQFVRLYTRFLRKEGLNQLLFWQRPEDSSNQTWRQAYSVRGIQYLIRTEQITASYQRDILQINISVETTDELSSKNNETRWIADQMVSGQLTQDQYRSLFYHSGQYLFGGIDIKQ